jgi:hypothetical protein
MPRLKHKLPSLRLHRPSGRAVVTLNGRDHYCGPWNTPEARAEYKRLIAEWLAAGRGAPQPAPGAPAPDPSVSEVLVAFLDHAEAHYRTPAGGTSRELENLKDALRPLRRLYGRSPAGGRRSRPRGPRRPTPRSPRSWSRSSTTPRPITGPLPGARPASWRTSRTRSGPCAASTAARRPGRSGR